MALGAMHKLYEHFVFAVLLLLTFGILVILVRFPERCVEPEESVGCSGVSVKPREVC